MRAVRVTSLGGPESLELVEIDDPADDGIVVDVYAAGVAFPDGVSFFGPEPAVGRLRSCPEILPSG